jgi:hypothetical protein
MDECLHHFDYCFLVDGSGEGKLLFVTETLAELGFEHDYSLFVTGVLTELGFGHD